MSISVGVTAGVCFRLFDFVGDCFVVSNFGVKVQGACGSGLFDCSGFAASLYILSLSCGSILLLLLVWLTAC